MATVLHGDVATAIGQQVEQMILQAKRDSEVRVRHEVQLTRTQLAQMEQAISELVERIGRCRKRGANGVDLSTVVDREFLTAKIALLEQKWQQEVKALKQDLHSTILAHNHNSDLIRHHRDTLEEARKMMETRQQPRAEQVNAQIEKVDRLLRAGQAKQRALDTMTERLGSMEAQVSELFPVARAPGGAGAAALHAGMPRMPGVGPGFPGGLIPPGMGGTAMTNPLAGASQLGGAGAGQAGRSPDPLLAQGGQGGKKKDGEALTDEEVRQWLAQATKAQAAGAAASVSGAADKAAAANAENLRAEAPVFVPRGAASSPGSSPSGGATLADKAQEKNNTAEEDAAGEVNSRDASADAETTSPSRPSPPLCPPPPPPGL